MIEEQRAVLEQALRIYEERNRKYNDNWRRFGWRGCVFRVRERAERAWDALFWAEDGAEAVDDLLDLINFAAFTVRAIREGNRDGTWFESQVQADE
jgi:hypothetical protein